MSEVSLCEVLGIVATVHATRLDPAPPAHQPDTNTPPQTTPLNPNNNGESSTGVQRVLNDVSELFWQP